MPLHTASLAAAVPGTQLSTRAPPWQRRTPWATHAPTPQLVDVSTKSSSVSPLQSSSSPSQTASLEAGRPGVQLSCTAPFTQDVVPLCAHTPRPQLRAPGTKSSSTSPSQSSSTPSHEVSLPMGSPGSQAGLTAPSTHSVLPVAEHAPTPQLTNCEG